MATNDRQSAFDEALKQLSTGRVVEGIDSLRSLRKQGFTSSELDVNLGRALVERGDMGEGLTYLESAVAIDRFDSRNRQDLEFAQSKVPNNAGTPMSHPAEYAHNIATYLRPLEALSISSLFLIVFGATVLIRGRKNPPKRSFVLSMLLFATLITSLGLFATTGRSMGYVMADVDLRSAPLESAEVIMPIKAGSRVRLIRRSGNYSEIERSNAFRGWVLNDSLTTSAF